MIVVFAARRARIDAEQGHGVGVGRVGHRRPGHRLGGVGERLGRAGPDLREGRDIGDALAVGVVPLVRPAPSEHQVDRPERGVERARRVPVGPRSG